MKAVVLCAGYGTRLGSLTERTPKPMLSLAGKPLLSYTLKNLAAQGFTEVAINLHFMADAIQSYFGDGSAHGVNLHYSYEPTLLGTAGTVRSLADFFGSDGSFLVLYGDILTDQDFRPAWELHGRDRADATIMLHKRLRSNSVVRMDENARITSFEERPDPSTITPDEASWVNSGMQILSRGILDDIPASGTSDLPKDVYVPLVNDRRFFGVPVTGFRCAIDSPQRYELAQQAISDGTYAV